MTLEGKVLLKPAEAAKMLGIELSTLYRWNYLSNTGQKTGLRRYKVRNRVYYDQRDIQAFIKGQVQVLA